MSDLAAPRFFSSKNAGAVQCELCPRHCVLKPGKTGQCRVRINRNGELVIPFYGKITGLAVDPIEKKPLYRFRPGTEILSVGFSGCNLSCPFCQNWHISQTTETQGRYIAPRELILMAKTPSTGAMHSIAYTYSEPLIHAEYLLNCMKEARKTGVKNVLVTNGCINAPAAAEILDLCDAANIDLKCFSENTYSKILGGSIEAFAAVLDFIRTALEKGVHVELTTLVIPGLNDSASELDKCTNFIAELEAAGHTVPWHLTAYRPCYKWNAPATDPGFLITAAKRAGEKLQFVYTGNIGF